jgi:hypothetical protein
MTENPTIPHHIVLPYPEGSDKKIRTAAALVEYEAVSKMLTLIKNELLGNEVRAEGLAREWANDARMVDAKGDLNSMKYSLSRCWRGPAFNAFNLYTIDAVGIMDKNAGAMDKIATTLASLMEIVYDTYAKALTCIGNCAAAISNLGLSMGIAAATAPVPGLNVLVSAGVLNKISDTLATFMQEMTALIAAAISQMGQYKAQGISFVSQATQFQVPEAVPNGTNQASQWQVNPNN